MGLVCIGPIIFVLLMGIIAGTSPEVVTTETMPATSMLVQLMGTALVQLHSVFQLY